MLGVTCAIVTKTLTFNQAFGAFCNEVIWLIVASFFFARGLEKTVRGGPAPAVQLAMRSAIRWGAQLTRWCCRARAHRAWAIASRSCL